MSLNTVWKVRAKLRTPATAPLQHWLITDAGLFVKIEDALNPVAPYNGAHYGTPVSACDVTRSFEGTGWIVRFDDWVKTPWLAAINCVECLELLRARMLMDTEWR